MGDIPGEVQSTQDETRRQNEENQRGARQNCCQEGGYYPDTEKEERQRMKIATFDNYRQEAGEWAEEFAERLQQACVEAYPHRSQEERDRIVFEHFVRTLIPGLRVVVTRAYVDTMEEALIIARRYEIQPIPDTQNTTITAIRANASIVLATMVERRFTVRVIDMEEGNNTASSTTTVPSTTTTIETAEIKNVQARIEELEQQPVEATGRKVIGKRKPRRYKIGKTGHRAAFY